MPLRVPPINLDRDLRVEGENPLAMPLDTTLPGQLLLVALRAGQALPEHRHGAPALLYVVRGAGAVTVEGTAYPVTAGDLFSLSAHDAHAVTARQDLVVLIYHVASAAPMAVAQEEPLLFAAASPLTLDVRHLTERECARRIFATVDALLPGEALRLITGHDPEPLLHVLVTTHPGAVGMQPERDGPDEWIMRITKIAPSPANRNGAAGGAEKGARDAKRHNHRTDPHR